MEDRAAGGESPPSLQTPSSLTILLMAVQSGHSNSTSPGHALYCTSVYTCTYVRVSVCMCITYKFSSHSIWEEHRCRLCVCDIRMYVRTYVCLSVSALPTYKFSSHSIWEEHRCRLCVCVTYVCAYVRVSVCFCITYKFSSHPEHRYVCTYVRAYVCTTSALLVCLCCCSSKPPLRRRWLH